MSLLSSALPAGFIAPCLPTYARRFVLAKVLEHFDGTIYSTGSFVSGHTLKHLAAVAAAFSASTNAGGSFSFVHQRGCSV